MEGQNYPNSAIKRWNFFVLFLLVLMMNNCYIMDVCGEEVDGDAVNDEADEHLVHISKIDKDSCTVDKDMEINFAGVQLLCGDNYYLAGFDKKPTIVLNRANIVSDMWKDSCIFLLVKD